MPKKLAPTKEHFAVFNQKMIDRGFERLSPAEIEEDRTRLGLVWPRRRREIGSEVGYCFKARELRVKVWTTWLEEKGTIREHDQGWVLITRGDQDLHYERPFNRTKKFLDRLFKYARINQERIAQRPGCEHCHTPAQIVRTEIPKDREWACQNIQNHPGQEQIVWSFNYRIPLHLLKYQQRDARRVRKYLEEREAAGKENFVALNKRSKNKAKITRPENFDWGA